MEYVIKMGLQNNSQESSSTDEDEEEEKEENARGQEEEEDQRIEYKERVLKGSFMPAMCMIKLGLASVEAPIDINQGLRLIHYACYFGKIKPLKALVE